MKLGVGMTFISCTSRFEINIYLKFEWKKMCVLFSEESKTKMEDFRDSRR